MKRLVIIYLLLVLILAALGLQACNFPGLSTNGLSSDESAQTSVAQTVAASLGESDDGTGEDTSPPGNEEVPTPTDEEIVDPTITLSPTISESPTLTLTPTLDKPMVSVSVDTNCRSGPGKIYDYIGALLEGEMAEVVGRSSDGQYWIIENPDLPGECWLWAEYAIVQGTTDGLPMYTPPPTPTPTFTWEGTWTIYLGVEGGPYETHPMTVTVDDKDFTAAVDLGGGVYTECTGTIADDYLSVSGTWTNPGMDGTFEFFALGANQFQGNGFNGIDTFSWCGGRDGAGQPSPCIMN